MTKKSSQKSGSKAPLTIASIAHGTEKPPQTASTGFSAVADSYIAAAVAASTKRIYAADQRHFEASGITVPATPVEVVEYLSKFAGQLAIATLDRRLSYLHKLHTEKCLPSPTTDAVVRLAMRGIRRTFGVKQRQVRPLVKENLLEALIASERQKPVKTARDKALLLVGFAGAFRRSELVGIRVEHVSHVDNGMEIYLPTSKTDQSGKGRTVFIPFAHGERCPVLALVHWLEIADIEDGFIFRAVTRHDRVAQQGLTAQSVALVVKAAVKRSGGDADTVSAHSLRSGFCTQAAMAGLPTWQVRETTGHTSDAMLSVYCRPVKRRTIKSLL